MYLFQYRSGAPTQKLFRNRRFVLVFEQKTYPHRKITPLRRRYQNQLDYIRNPVSHNWSLRWWGRFFLTFFIISITILVLPGHRIERNFHVWKNLWNFKDCSFSTFPYRALFLRFPIISYFTLFLEILRFVWYVNNTAAYVTLHDVIMQYDVIYTVVLFKCQTNLNVSRTKHFPP